MLYLTRQGEGSIMGLVIRFSWLKMEKREYCPVYKAKEGFYYNLGYNLG
jgi:hypothetical protein